METLIVIFSIFVFFAILFGIIYLLFKSPSGAKFDSWLRSYLYDEEDVI